MNILITGASRGLGLEMLREAVARGHFVYANVRKEEQIKQLKSQLTENQLLQIAPLVFDVKDEEAICRAAKDLQERGVVLDVIVNSAAVLLARQTSIEDLDFANMYESFDVNLYGTMRVVKHFKPLLSKQDASIINISSEAGSITNAYAGDYPYSLSKCALNLFTEQLKRDLAKQDIEVWSIHPGWMKTDMGGSQAPLAPAESAIGILDIIERRVEIDSPFSFINYKGEPMLI